ncbi:MAG: hypothetical protein GYA34_05380 [Chloroflexi bacterium]|nr:hypothetical protein [Chloroflexota bacterium]
MLDKFLAHLTAWENVAMSTHNLALSALLFLSHEVLKNTFFISVSSGEKNKIFTGGSFKG